MITSAQSSVLVTVFQCFKDRELPEKICWWVRKCGNICWNYTWCPSRVFLLLLPQWLLTSKSYLIPSEQRLTFYRMACNLCLSPLSKSSMRVCVDSLHACTMLIRQIYQDDVNWLHFNWIINMIWLIKQMQCNYLYINICWEKSTQWRQFKDFTLLR